MPEDSQRELSPYRLLREPIAPYDEYGGAVPAEEEVHLRDYWRVLVKHRRRIAAIFLVVVATTAVVTFTMDPLYTATSTIQIERHAPQIAPVEGVQQIDPAAAGYDKYDYYQTQYEVLESRSVAARVIRALGLGEDRRFTGEDESRGLLALTTGWLRSLFSGAEDEAPAGESGVDPRLVDRYLDMLGIDPVRNSRLVNVAFTSEYPDLSAEAANRHVEEYVNASLEQRVGMTLKAKEFLEQELAKAKDRVDSAEIALNQFRKEKGVVSLEGDETDIVSARLADLNRRFTEAQGERIRLEGQYHLVKDREYESLPDVLASPLVTELKQQVAKIGAERAELAKKYKPRYPKMAETLAREEEAKSRLRSEIANIVVGIESSYLAARGREKELGRQLEEQRQLALRQKDVGADYSTLKRDVDSARGLYNNLLQRLKDVDVAEEIKVSNVSVVDRAGVPREPSKPKKLLNLLLASVLGLMLGVGFAFFVEYLDDTVKTPEDVERRLGLPTLGVVPSFDIPGLAYGYGYGGPAGNGKTKRARRAHIPAPANGDADGNGAGNGTELVVTFEPWSVVSEAYRAIRTGILLSSADAPPQVILFTSGSAGEGKTVTAVNQAMTLVQSGGRVLLIDADIRKPRVHRIFDLPNGHGLSTWLTGQSDLEQVIHEVPANGKNGAHAPAADAAADGNGHGNGHAPGSGRLFVLPSGPLPPNPAELLGSRRMRDTLAHLRERFDYVILDTAPVLPVTDSVLLSTMADGVVLVVRGQETPTHVARKSHDRLAHARAKIIGVVLNDVDVTSGDYSQYHRYYYSYYSGSAGSDRPEA